MILTFPGVSSLISLFGGCAATAGTCTGGISLFWVAVVALPVLFVAYLLWSRGRALRASKQFVGNTHGDISYVDQKLTSGTSASDYTNVAALYYNLVTDFYLYGWGESFHFYGARKGESNKDAMTRYHQRLVDELELKPGMKVLDCGAGVAGPARDIHRLSGADVTAITICPYQVEVGNRMNKEQGVSDHVRSVLGNYCDLHMFEPNSIDAIYCIESTCYAPKLEMAYGEFYRLLKPGGKLAVMEWVSTVDYHEDFPEHKRVIDLIVKANAMPCMRNCTEVAPAGVNVGFKVVREYDDMDNHEVPWYRPLEQKFGWSIPLTKLTVPLLEFLRIAPKGTTAVHDYLLDAGRSCVEGGRRGIFTVGYYVLFEKPKN